MHRKIEERFRRLVEVSSQIVWVTDGTGAPSEDSPSWRAFTGRSVEEWFGWRWIEAIHPEDRERVANTWRAALDARRPYFVEFRMQRADGAWRDMISRAVPVLDDTGAVREWIGMNVDISTQRSAEAALRESERESARRAAELQTLLDTVPAAVYIARDPEATRIEGNRYGYRMLRADPGENVSKSAPAGEEPRYRVLRNGAEVAPADMPLQVAARERREVRDWECEIAFDDGSPSIHLLECASPVGEEGAAAAIGVAVDITARKRAEDEVRRSDQRKSEFIGVLSHELRNPLASIRNAVHVLDAAPPDSPRARRARDVIRRQTDHLACLVDDLLDVTRIGRGKIDLHRTVFDLVDAVRQAADDLHAEFDGSGVALRVETPAAPVWVDADRTRIAQALGNLLHNAVKFTPSAGEVVVSVVAGSGEAEVKVRDTGVGLAPEVAARLFEPFSQGDRSLARTGGGLGLGLALAKGMMELHGGAIRARSDGPGRGSEFSLVVPTTYAPATSGPVRPVSAVRPRRVVVIEDNVEAADMLAELLAGEGHEVEVARDGRSGIALVLRLGPDLVLCDVGLPDVSGYEVARELRANGVNPGTRLVAVTGYAQTSDVARATEAGFDAHVAKPLSLDDLDALLSTP